MFDWHERPDRQAIRARGQWAIDPVDCARAVQVATLINYVVWYFKYFTESDDQMVRVEPTTKARTLTMGRRPASGGRLGCSD